MSTEKTLAYREAWSAYWDHESGGGAPAVRGEAQSEALDRHWATVLEPLVAARKSLKFLDLACGAGVVTDTMIGVRERAGGCEVELHCSDYADGALRALEARLPGEALSARAADARDLPYDDNQFDVVVSQYGLEYAGLDAFSEAGRITSPDGEFHALVHLKDGAIYQECQGNLAVLDAISERELLPRFGRLLRVASKVEARKTQPSVLKTKMDEMSGVTAEIVTVLQAAEPGSARAHGERLLADLRQVFDRWKAYEQSDLDAWLSGQARDLETFRHRMTSMMQAALDEAQRDEAVSRLKSAGFDTVETVPFEMSPGSLPAAWQFRARNA